jgi:hypothetical protein
VAGAVVAKRAAIIEASEISGPPDLLILAAGNRFDKIDDGSPKLWVWNLHESLGELESVSSFVRHYDSVVYSPNRPLKLGKPARPRRGKSTM